ncbi:hypothetical protein [Vitiosangium sp. GDMCC 1.1324]|uniref:hypothetical protein n=1 Tax=Vitiosangium sp. (strain GDMCC 1.1324) TaxID=2138576 RepID=UPI000D3D7F5A|nr:hypothetical protein [Vitiosangium sp. GDMCC 1.1324]PTL75416.1 hypothetical protein DAT35_54865 [Vitiosangium sp. GDMCC 1.1324]
MDTVDTRLTGLALSWLTTRPQRRGTRKALEDALRPFVENRFSRAEWKERSEALVAELLRGSQVAERGRDGLELTAEGRKQVLRFLSQDALPRGMTWKKLKATHLQARSLSLPPSRATLTWLAKASGLRAAVLKRRYGVEGKEDPTLEQVRDRLLWRQLGVETDRPFTLSAVQAHLLSKILEMEVSNPRRGVEQLAARAVGATRVDAEVVRIAALRGWLMPSTESTSVANAGRDTVPSSAAAPAATTLSPTSTTEAFAKHVLEVARTVPAGGRFGPNKVFIAHVWRALQPEWSSREAFNAALLEANRARHLSLSRADLVSVMNPSDVAESEVRSHGASFHFVVL